MKTVFPIFTLDLGTELGESPRLNPCVLVSSKRGKPAITFTCEDGMVASLPVRLGKEEYQEWEAKSALLIRSISLEGTKSARVLFSEQRPVSSAGSLLLARVWSNRQFKFEKESPDGEVFLNRFSPKGIAFFAGIIPAGEIVSYFDDRWRYVFFDGTKLVIASQYTRNKNFDQAAEAARLNHRAAIRT